MSVRRAKYPWVRVAIWIVCLFPIAQVFGQSSTGNPISDLEQQVLQGMSPEQRDSIMNQLGVGGGSNNTPSGVNRRPEDNQQNQLDQRSNPLRPSPEQKAEMDRLSPFLQGDDWIIVAIDSNPLPGLSSAPASSSLGAALSGAAGASGGAQQSALAAALQQNPALAGSAASALSQPGASGLSQLATQPQGAATGPTTATAGGYAPLGDTTTTANRDSQNPPPELTDEEKRARDKLISLIRSKNPYQLSHDGTLSLPGFAAISLGGLTEQLATLRLGSEPALRQLYIRVTKLPLRKVGRTSLQPFGYDLFDRSISTFAPVTNVPVPAAYVVGPGDQLQVQLYGKRNAFLELTVGRDGRVQFPDLGPISVAGRTFDSARELIESTVARQMIGVQASITMADTRSIRVFVLGESLRPGSYTISGLGTITSALFAAGGIRSIGSLRKIQLKRQGVLVKQLDLYDMLIRGNTTDDAKLLPGDVIFIPPVGPTVSIDGEVRRPAIYETKGETSIASVVELAGGLTPEADKEKAALTRVDANQRRIVLQVDLSGLTTQAQPVRNGDFLRVPRLRPTLDAGVTVDGYAYTTGAFAYHVGMRLTDVIHSADDLRPNADQHYLLVRRELPPDRRIVVLSADLDAALIAPGSPADIVLMPRDQITAFDRQSSRDRVIEPLLESLKLQSTNERPDNVVRIEGRVNVPGQYPLEEGMTVRDLVRAGGGLSDAAYGGQAELTRYVVSNGEMRRTELLQIDLTAALKGDPVANIRLQPFDGISVKEVPAWEEQQEITLRGEVKFPGRYSIKRGETLKSVVTRAGGLTDLAFTEGAVFTRKDLREREQKQLDMLAKRMQSDIAFLALQGANANQSQAGSALAVGQSLLDQLKANKAVGRLVINLKGTLRSPVGSRYDVLLRDGDQLIVPKYQQEVTVIGEVQSSTSHLWQASLTRADYIAMSGGETRRADHSRVYVVRADGSVVANEGGRWFSTSDTRIKTGDTIVVPLNAEHLPALPLWQAVTQIIYNIAIAAAAVHSF
jgi:polysaccharide export outer membrane protein